MPVRFLWFPLAEEGLFLFLHEALLDAGLLAGEIAQVIEFCAANLTVLVDGDRFDEGRFNREDTFHSDAVGNLAHGEALFVLMARDADYHTAILLDTFLVALFDTVSDSDGVAGAKLIEFFFRSCECFLRDFN